jgi:RHS repeat-associated protein
MDPRAIGLKKLLWTRTSHHQIAGFGLALLVYFLGPTQPLRAQQQDEDPLLNIGIPSLSMTIPVPSGYVNAGNVQLTIEIPLLGAFPQRSAQPVATRLEVRGVSWFLTNTNLWMPGSGGGANSDSSLLRTSPGFGIGGWGGGDLRGTICRLDGVEEWDTYGGFTYADNGGMVHAFPITTTMVNTTSQCRFTHADVPTADGLALDGSGFHIYVVNYTVVSAVYAPDGTLVYSCTSYVGCNPQYSRKDSNGNELNLQVTPQLTDTAGRTILSETYNGSTTTDAVLNSKGATSLYSSLFTTINVKSNFKATTANTGADSSGSSSVLQSVQLPDGTKYTFQYDCDSTKGNPVCASPGGQTAYYGDLTVMNLPTGAQITYSYQNFEDAEGSYFPDGFSYTHITRVLKQMTTPDGTWNFSPLVITYGQNAGQQQLTVTKPGQEKAVYKVAFNGGVRPYETDYYDAAGNLDASITATYNYSNGSCGNVMKLEGICLLGSALYVDQLTDTITLPVPGSGGTVSTTTGFTWDPAHTGNITQKSEWNFGSSTSGSADRATTYTYLASPNVNLVDRPTSVTVKNSGGTIIAQTINCYDGSTTSPCNYSSTPASATGKTQHDDTGYPVTYTSRGNLTQVLKLISGTSNYLSTSRTVYDMTGQIVSTLDSNGNQTSYDYTDNFFDDSGDSANPPATHSVSQSTNAYLKKVTHPTVNGVTLTDTFGYYWGSGKKTLLTDPNGQSSYYHFYDPYGLDRPTSAQSPNSGWTFIQYAANERQVDSGIGITSTTETATCGGTSGGCRQDEKKLDPMGRDQYQILVSDPEGSDTVYTTYDSNGRVKTVSNPYRSTASPTDGTETYNYDGLDRKVQITRADGGNEYTYYGSLVTAHGGIAEQCATSYGYGYPVLTVDEAGNMRQTWTDGFGRMIEVDEPSTSGSLSSGVKTCYAYDLNNNLIGVLQPGGSESSCVASNGATYNRCFSYDMISRLTSATNPEVAASTSTGASTVNYYYTTTISGTTPCSGDPSAVCLRVAPKPNQSSSSVTVQTTYMYDALNRLILKSYNDSTTPTMVYGYDAVNPTGCTPPTLSIPYGKSRRTSMCDGSGQTAYSYDQVGNLWTDVRKITSVSPNVSETVSATYNLDSSTASITYPSARLVTYTTGNAQRTTTAYDSANHYALGPTNCPFGQSNNQNWACYSPPGELDALKNGASLTETMFYNNRLQPCRTAVNTTGGNTPPASCLDSNTGDKFDIKYSFDFSSLPAQLCTLTYTSYTNNGNVASIANNMSGKSGRSQQFCYDALNRVNSAQTTAIYSTSSQFCWAEAYTVDAIANLSQIAQVSSNHNGSYAGCNEESGFTATINSHNQDSLSCYDAAGNKVGVPSCSPNLPTTYFYDGENRICAFGGTSCITGTMYTYDGDGNRVEKSSGTLYWYGPHGETLAETNTTGGDLNEYIFFGSKRIARVNSSGNVFYYFADHLGTSRVIVQDGTTPTLCYDADFYPYGVERPPYTNTCSQNYKFNGKERDSESGLDNFGARYNSSQYGRFMTLDPSGIWLANLSDPQQLNLYSYVRNNPLSLTDPTGLDCVYLNDAGNGVDDNGIDHNSNQGECWNNGGYWANGNVSGASSVQTDPNSNTIGIFSTDSNGNTGYSIAGQGWTQNPGSWSASMMYSPASAGPDLTPPTSQQAIAAISAQTAPLAKLSDCAGQAAASQIPFHDKLGMNTPDMNDNTPLARADSALDTVDKAGLVAGQSERISHVLNAAELPNIAEKLAQYGPKAAAGAEALAPIGAAATAANVAAQTYACYNKGGR